ncbi:hypothetical protein EF912_18820 [Streptomyces sp. WAC07061]|uniref:hypothetical protein n=1 Tax=Streptomyces sp. WAC07061 TaxID=2487410 RepID=UPI000F76C8CC|nr:hypothetical protein [Streptomyces sp. WAC07061]RSS52919.1 hypothetical protein EF912_18820 [Streptomyces sp. WAC07061]
MLITRSAQESHLYMDLHACVCGANRFDREHHVEDRDGVLVSVYEGACSECGRTRVFEFVFADDRPVAPPAFGGPEPSQIIDPGEFLWVARRLSLASGQRLLNTPNAEHREIRPTVAYAAAALEEVVKFLPEEADRIPEERFTSELGREMYAQDPSRFKRAFLVSTLERDRKILAGIDRVSPPLG